MRFSFEFSWSVALGFFAGGAAFDCDWLWGCVPSDDAPAFGKRGISSSAGKLGEEFAGGRRLLTRGTSASAKRKSVSDKASQIIVTHSGPWTEEGPRIHYSTMPGGP